MGASDESPSSQIDAAFEEFVRTKSAHLLRLALLLTGWNAAVAEDLTQTALERIYRRRRLLFGRPEERGSIEPYVRRVLVNAAIDWRRGLHRRPELPLDLALDVPQESAGRIADRVADRDLLLRALACVPQRQRAVLVLRYWEDLSDAEIALTLNCEVGTVRSQASRGLAKLRELTRLAPQPARAEVGRTRARVMLGD
ncbi:MAG TPA: sigma-70 family RNA polymerase sigma factor [Streptosporangiaceae bacterium]|nr:sigma-70 family RNA polymerase sigma factor [Streptosporangiaceae bacterium]